jgi:hypothetical protein
LLWLLFLVFLLFLGLIFCDFGGKIGRYFIVFGVYLRDFSGNFGDFVKILVDKIGQFWGRKNGHKVGMTSFLVKKCIF